MINDQTTKGIIAGVIGAVVQNIYIYFTQLLGFTKLNYQDYSQVVIFLRIYKGMLPTFLGILGHFVWDILFGIIFAYLIKFTPRKLYIIKGVVYGVIIWYLIKLGATLFRLTVFMSPPPNSVFVFFIGSILYGAAIAYVLKVLDTKSEKIE